MSNIDNIAAAFTEEQVGRLTNLSAAQLRYWDRTGFFSPDYAAGSRRSPFSRIYSFKNVVALRTLRMLRKEHNVPLQHLRKVAEELSDLAGELWTRTTLYVLNRRVIVQDSRTDRPKEAVSGQYVLDIPLKVVVKSVQSDFEHLKRRELSQFGKIEQHRNVSHNAAVLAGTRIPIETIERFIEDGYSTSAIIREYPNLTEADIDAVVRNRKSVPAA